MFLGTDALLCEPSLFLLPLLMPGIWCTRAVPVLPNSAQLRERGGSSAAAPVGPDSHLEILL